MEALGQETLYWISQDTLRRIGENDDTLISWGYATRKMSYAMADYFHQEIEISILNLAVVSG